MSAVVSPLTIADDLVAAIAAFAADVGGTPVAVARIYHDDAKTKSDEIKVSVIPYRMRKEAEGKQTKLIEADFAVVVQLQIPKKDQATIDGLVNYVLDLDAHLENTTALDGLAWPKIAADDIALWLPDDLHDSQRFTAILPLTYYWKTKRGFN